MKQKIPDSNIISVPQALAPKHWSNVLADFFFYFNYVFLELTGLLVHSNWTHKHGWRFQKRPGLDIFLSQIGYPNFEVVIWTVENGMTFFPIINGMDPQGQYIMYRLFRDATHYINGHHCKDLSRLNRDLKKVIVVDWNRETVQVRRRGKVNACCNFSVEDSNHYKF